MFFLIWRVRGKSDLFEKWSICRNFFNSENEKIFKFDENVQTFWINKVPSNINFFEKNQFLFEQNKILKIHRTEEFVHKLTDGTRWTAFVQFFEWNSPLLTANRTIWIHMLPICNKSSQALHYSSSRVQPKVHGPFSPIWICNSNEN